MLAEPLDMSLAAVIQHLQVLEDSGLVHTQKEGRVRTCHLHAAALAEAERWFRDRRSLWERRFDRLGELLEECETKPKKE
jgi:DNA-binding transcriptional ArsR family regulator